jgi:hypothetical protein
MGDHRRRGGQVISNAGWTDGGVAEQKFVANEILVAIDDRLTSKEKFVHPQWPFKFGAEHGGDSHCDLVAFVS